MVSYHRRYLFIGGLFLDRVSIVVIREYSLTLAFYFFDKIQQKITYLEDSSTAGGALPTDLLLWGANILSRQAWFSGSVKSNGLKRGQ